MNDDATSTGKFPAMILAGGLSRRMGGGDKGLRLIAGRTLIAHLIDRLAPQCGPLALNANGDPARFAELGLPVLADSVADHPGPLAGILAAMDWAAGLGAPAVLTAAADTPFPPPDLAQRLAQAQQGAGPAIATSRDAGGELRDHPIFGLWPVALRDGLRRALADGERRVTDFTRRHDTGRAIWDGQPHDPFFNINHPGDLIRAEAFAGLRG